MTTFAPSSRRASALARPSPDEAPSTSAVRPSSPRFVWLLAVGGWVGVPRLLHRDTEAALGDDQRGSPDFHRPDPIAAAVRPCVEQRRPLDLDALQDLDLLAEHDRSVASE